MYNFIRGVATMGQPVALITGDESIQVTDAISYSLSNADRDMKGENVRVRCKDGWLLVN